MAKQNLNYGSTPNDGTGDNLRNASIKIQSNFDELYARGLQEVTDVNNETTNSITALSHLLPPPFSGGSNAGIQENGQVIAFNALIIDTQQDGTALASIYAGEVSASRNYNLPNFDVYLNGCTPADNYTNDTTAAAGGIAIGQMYHTAGVVKIRLT